MFLIASYITISIITCEKVYSSVKSDLKSQTIWIKILALLLTIYMTFSDLDALFFSLLTCKKKKKGRG